MRCSLTKCVEMSWLLYKTNRFHFAVGLYSDNAQRTSKLGENISHATRLRLVAYFVLLCSHHVLTSFVRYQSTDARQNGIYLLIYFLTRCLEFTETIIKKGMNALFSVFIISKEINQESTLLCFNCSS